MDFEIKEAVQTDAPIKIGIAGPQASGKTTSALRIATGITSVTGGKILVIDTENSRALTYADNFKFQHMDFQPPFSPSAYLNAIQAAGSHGYGPKDVIVVDSMSHEHEGPGGALEAVESFLNQRAGDDYQKRDKLKLAAWVKPKQERVKTIQQGIQRNESHIILCFRAKDKVVPRMVNGKLKMVELGVQPIGGAEYFYEMAITFILPESSNGKPDWSQAAARINEYGDGPLKKKLHNTNQISEETGSSIAKLLLTNQDFFITENQAKYLIELSIESGTNNTKFLEWIGSNSFREIKKVDFEKATNALKQKMENQNGNTDAVQK